MVEDGYFNPRAPCGARPIRRLKGSTPPIFQSTRPVRGATLKAGKITPAQKISIHAPRAGRDEHDERRRAGRDYFNPRAPCGARPYTLKTTAPSMTFQSTRPVRGATLLYQRERRRGRIFQSTRPVRGATGRGADRDDHLRISIHAPRAGRDAGAAYHRRAGGISIHAPRAGRDHCWRWRRKQKSHFNPRAPCGARPSGRRRKLTKQGISIHAPRAGRDVVAHGLEQGRGISIHAPRAGRDVAASVTLPEVKIFQSTRPVRGATRMVCALYSPVSFQSTRPVRGATCVPGPRSGSQARISIHAPRAGRDLAEENKRQDKRIISIHAPRAGRDPWRSRWR